MAKESLAGIFRAYDVRGIVNQELTAEVMARIGAAFGTHLGGDKRVCIGRDVRTSSPLLERAFAAGLASTGCEAVSVGLLPIPTSNFATLRFGFDAGAYITASHNPPEYNGVRFRHPDGTGYTDENSLVRDLFFGTALKKAGWRSLGRLSELSSAEVANQYIDFIVEKTRMERAMSVALDPGNGASALTAPAIFRRLGLRVEVINGEPDAVEFHGPNAEVRGLRGVSRRSA